MREGQSRSVEGKALVSPWNILPKVRPVSGIPQHSMAGFGKVNADLIAATGFQADSDMRNRGTL